MEEKILGKTKNTLISAIRNVSIPCHRGADPETLTVCSAIARFMPLETNAAEISNIMRRDLKIVRIVSYLIRRKLRLCDRKISGTCCDDAESKRSRYIKMKMSNQRKLKYKKLLRKYNYEVKLTYYNFSESFA